MDQVRKRKSAADRKAEIVDTVIKLSASMGPDRVTTQHLADAVGVTQPAIFRHFGTKAEIWDAVSQRIVGDIDELARGAGTAVEGLRAYVASFVDLVRSRPALPSILHSLELQSENVALRDRFHSMHRDRETLIAGIVEQGQDSREIRQDVNPRDVAKMVISSLHGLTLDWTLRGQVFDLQEEGERLVDNLLDLIKA